ncbi:hypothetical protein D9M71_359510 [compost metagenome]
MSRISVAIGGVDSIQLSAHSVPFPFAAKGIAAECLATLLEGFSAGHNQLVRGHGVDLDPAGGFKPVDIEKGFGNGAAADQQTMVSQDHGVVRPEVRDQAVLLSHIDLRP